MYMLKFLNFLEFKVEMLVFYPAFLREISSVLFEAKKCPESDVVSFRQLCAIYGNPLDVFMGMTIHRVRESFWLLGIIFWEKSVFFLRKSVRNVPCHF